MIITNKQAPPQSNRMSPAKFNFARANYMGVAHPLVTCNSLRKVGARFIEIEVITYMSTLPKNVTSARNSRVLLYEHVSLSVYVSTEHNSLQGVSAGPPPDWHVILRQVMHLWFAASVMCL